MNAIEMTDLNPIRIKFDDDNCKWERLPERQLSRRWIVQQDEEDQESELEPEEQEQEQEQENKISCRFCHPSADKMALPEPVRRRNSTYLALACANAVSQGNFCIQFSITIQWIHQHVNLIQLQLL